MFTNVPQILRSFLRLEGGGLENRLRVRGSPQAQTKWLHNILLFLHTLCQILVQGEDVQHLPLLISDCSVGIVKNSVLH